MSANPKRAGSVPVPPTPGSVPPPEQLAYVYPWVFFIVVAPAFLLFNYMAYFAADRVEGEVYWTTKPAYLTGLEKQSMLASRSNHWSAGPLSLVCLVCFYFEEMVSVIAAYLSMVLVRKALLSQLCTLCWIIHFYEVGLCFKTCRQCHATWATTLKYMLATSLGGIAQMKTMNAEVNEYVKRERRRRDKMKKN